MAKKDLQPQPLQLEVPLPTEKDAAPKPVQTLERGMCTDVIVDLTVV